MTYGGYSPGRDRREQIAAQRRAYQRSSQRRSQGGWASGIFFLVLVAAGLIYFPIMEWGTEHDVTFTVQALDDQATRSGHQYMIFTTSGEQYTDTDAFWHGKHDSSVVWSDFLKWGTGATVTCPVYGYRRGWPTSYPDILDGCKVIRVGKPVSAVGG